MTLDARARRATAVLALLGTGALGVGALGLASPALAAPKPHPAAKPHRVVKAKAAPKAAPKATASPKPAATPKPSSSAKPAPSVITVTGLSSAFGSTAGGTNIVISGKGFGRVDPASKTAVQFGKTPATTFLILSDSQIAATVPAGSGAKVQVSVTDGTNTSPDVAADDFSYLDPITAVVADKTELSAAGGTVARLTLSGTKLDLGTSQSTFSQKKITATVDGAPAPLTWVDATHVDMVAPAGTSSKSASKVLVYNNGVAGVADTTHARYVSVITKLSVVSGKTTGTTGAAGKPALTITGVGLTDATGFTFGAAKATCTAVSGKDDTTWTCASIPAGTAGAVVVTPTFSDGRTAGLTAGAIYVYTNL